MANTQATQAFYSLTLEPPSAPAAACTCNVIPGLKAQDQQIFEARGQRLLLHRIVENEDRTEVKVSTFLDQDAFGIVRGVSSLRIPGTAVGKSIYIQDAFGKMAAVEGQRYAGDKIQPEVTEANIIAQINS